MGHPTYHVNVFKLKWGIIIMDRQVTPPKRKREKLIIVFTFSIKRGIRKFPVLGKFARSVMHVQSYCLKNFRPAKKIWPDTSFTRDRSIFFAVHTEPNFERPCVCMFVRLRWCYRRRYAATQPCNVGTTLQPFETISQQCCNAVLRLALKMVVASRLV